jgi:glyoxylase-like metal-dependent hydrolase (beta-lactamase superfamily II)
MHSEVQAFFDKPTNTLSYVVRDPQSNACAIIDAVLDFDPASGRTSAVSAQAIAAFVEGRDLHADWILETHVHADHLSAAPYLKQRLGGKIGIGGNITIVQNVFGKVFNAGSDFQRDGSQFDALFDDSAEIAIGGLRGRAIHTPGHTPACMTYIFGDAAFVGDTLFMPDYGTARCDFPGGDARQLYRSIQKIFALPPQTRLFLCHDYLPPAAPNIDGRPRSPSSERTTFRSTMASPRISSSRGASGATPRCECRGSSSPPCKSTCGPGSFRPQKTMASLISRFR